MPDVIVLACELAFKAYERGEITKEKMIKIVKIAINARAKENGYDEKFGIPFPESEEDSP